MSGALALRRLACLPALALGLMGAHASAQHDPNAWQVPGAAPPPAPAPPPPPAPLPPAPPPATPPPVPPPTAAPLPPPTPSPLPAPLAPAEAAPDKEKPYDPEIPGMVSGETAEDGGRTMSGHTFPIPNLGSHAFVASSFSTGAALAFRHVSDLPGFGGTLPYSYDSAFVILRFGLDVAPAKFLAVAIDAQYDAQVGANLESIFFHGGTTALDIRPGLRARFFRSESSGTQLGLHGYGIIQSGLTAMPFGPLSGVAGEILRLTATDPAAAGQCVQRLLVGNFRCGNLNDERLLDATLLTTFGGGGGAALHFGQALGKYVGVQATAGVEGTSLTTSWDFPGFPVEFEAGGVGFVGGIMPSLNFYPSLPIGASLEYKIRAGSGTLTIQNPTVPNVELDQAPAEHRFAAGLYYTGRRDLQLGWIFSLAYQPERTAAAANDYGANVLGLSAGLPLGTVPETLTLEPRFMMRYFF